MANTLVSGTMGPVDIGEAIGDIAVRRQCSDEGDGSLKRNDSDFHNLVDMSHEILLLKVTIAQDVSDCLCPITVTSLAPLKST